MNLSYTVLDIEDLTMLMRDDSKEKIEEDSKFDK
jgi:hypothetical protein